MQLTNYARTRSLLLHRGWTGVDAQTSFEYALGECSVAIVNDAEAAAVAESAFG